LPTRFRYKGTAYAASGIITTPFKEIIETQAPATLSEAGGYSCARVPAFSHRNFLKFDSAHTEVTGSRTHHDQPGETYSTLVKASIEGVNIMGMITADLVVANLVSTYNSTVDDEPSVKLIGSRFENLKVAGIPVKVEMSIGTLDRHHRHKDLKKAYATDPHVRNLFGDAELKKRHAAAPPEVKNYLDAPPDEGSEMPQSAGYSTVSIVKRLIPECDALECYGHVIHIEGFGTIRLGEVRVCNHTRALTMIAVHLGCPVEGDGDVGCVADGGTSA
jgi:hypothetical protein